MPEKNIGLKKRKKREQKSLERCGGRKMTKKVTTIPALLNKQSTNQVGTIKKRRVAAYAKFQQTKKNN